MKISREKFTDVKFYYYLCAPKKKFSANFTHIEYVTSRYPQELSLV